MPPPHAFKSLISFDVTSKMIDVATNYPNHVHLLGLKFILGRTLITVLHVTNMTDMGNHLAFLPKLFPHMLYYRSEFNTIL